MFGSRSQSVFRPNQVWEIDTMRVDTQCKTEVAGTIRLDRAFVVACVEDTQLIASELFLVEVQPDLLKQLHKAAKGSIRLITVGLSRIEAFARVQRWDSINATQWSGHSFFFLRQVDYQDD